MRKPYVKTLICGHGINDANHPIYPNDKAYFTWKGIIERCYNEKRLEKFPTYRGCSVCEEWKRFSVFEKWFYENFIDDNALDKDILVKGNKIYSPDTCCFVPKEINNIFHSTVIKENGLPVGIQKKGNRYVSRGVGRGYVQKLSKGSYISLNEAIMNHFEAKTLWLHELAEKFYTQERLSKRMYDFLRQYVFEVES